jgi:hypothetical protein
VFAKSIESWRSPLVVFNSPLVAMTHGRSRNETAAPPVAASSIARPSSSMADISLDTLAPNASTANEPTMHTPFSSEDASADEDELTLKEKEMSVRSDANAKKRRASKRAN